MKNYDIVLYKSEFDFKNIKLYTHKPYQRKKIHFHHHVKKNNSYKPITIMFT